MHFPTSQVEALDQCLLALHAIDRSEQLIPEALALACRLVASDTGLYGVSDLSHVGYRCAYAAPYALPPPRGGDLFLRHFWDHPLNAQHRTVVPGGAFDVARQGGKKWRQSALYNEFFRPVDLTEQLLVRLPSPDGLVDAIGVARSSRPFSPVEARVLEIFVRHLQAVADRLGGVVCPQPGGDSASSAGLSQAGDRLTARNRILASWQISLGLSNRQRQVLIMILDGMSNKEIANGLRCAEVTVEYHLTVLFRKTRTASRTQLVSAFWTGQADR